VQTPKTEGAGRNFALVVVVFTICFAAGCTKTVANRTARFEGNQGGVLEVAPRTGVYKVKYSTPADQDGKSVADSSRVLRQGQHIGFRRDDNGVLFAIAGDEEFEIHNPPADVARFCWYHRYEKPTQFANNMSLALEATGHVAGTAAVVGLVGAGVAGAVLLNDAGCDGNSDFQLNLDPPEKSKHRHHR
jgi:hypothetical protein